MNRKPLPLRFLLPVFLVSFVIAPALHAQDWVRTGTNLGVQRIRNDKIAAIDLDRQLDKVKSDVVTAHQASIMAAKEVPIATEQVASAEEALRLTRENFKAGTALTVDVLQAEGAADQAHVRYATAIVRYNQSQVNLLATLGVLDDQSIRGSQTPASPVSPAN